MIEKRSMLRCNEYCVVCWVWLIQISFDLLDWGIIVTANCDPNSRFVLKFTKSPNSSTVSLPHVSFTPRTTTYVRFEGNTRSTNIPFKNFKISKEVLQIFVSLISFISETVTSLGWATIQLSVTRSVVGSFRFIPSRAFYRLTSVKYCVAVSNASH